MLGKLPWTQTDVSACVRRRCKHVGTWPGVLSGLPPNHQAQARRASLSSRSGKTPSGLHPWQFLRKDTVSAVETKHTLSTFRHPVLPPSVDTCHIRKEIETLQIVD